MHTKKKRLAEQSRDDSVFFLVCISYNISAHSFPSPSLFKPIDAEAWLHLFAFSKVEAVPLKEGSQQQASQRAEEASQEEDRQRYDQVSEATLE